MRTYLFNIIPKLQQYSQELDNTALLTSQHWVVLDEGGEKVTYIFRPSGDLLISQEGQVQRAKWEYLGNQTLLIDRGDKSYLFKHGFFNEHVLAMKVDGRDEYAVLVSDNQFEKGINSVEAVAKLLAGISAAPGIEDQHVKMLHPFSPSTGEGLPNQEIVTDPSGLNLVAWIVIIIMVILIGKLFV